VHSRNTIFKLAHIRISATKALKFDRTSGSKQHNINFHVFFDYTAGKTCFLSLRPTWWCTNEAASESLGSWIPEIQFLSWPKFVSLLQRPQNSIEHQVRNSIILTFTSFSITQLEKPAFYLHARGSGAGMRERQKAYGPWITEMQFSSWPKFESLLQRP
jgi:hypothetical protein